MWCSRFWSPMLDQRRLIEFCGHRSTSNRTIERSFQKQGKGRTQHTHVHPIVLANEIKVRVWGAPSSTAEGKRRCGHTWRMRSSPAKGWAKTGQMAPPLAQSSPPGKEGRRAYERREKGPERQSPEREPGGLSMSRAQASQPPRGCFVTVTKFYIMSH